MEIVVAPDLAQVFVDRFVEAANAAITQRGRFDVALSGGSAVKLYARLPSQGLDWSKIHLWWADERAVAPDHPDSNYRGAREALIDRVQTNVHRMPADEPDLEAAARAYEAALPRLDLVHLGMGPDGHVASLFPGHPLLGETSRRVAPMTDSPKPPPRRLTLTLPAIVASDKIILTVAGAEKRNAVRAALEDPACELPAAKVARAGSHVVWLLDPSVA